MRVIFMGTPQFAVPSLEKLIQNYGVVGVFTQPDKSRGRGLEVTYSPIKEVAIKYGIEVYQPQKIKTTEWTTIIKNLNPDVIVVIAYGQILSQEILNIPQYGCINVHASLLPKLRGASPINSAIVQGYEASGVTTMKMDVGLDTGDIIKFKEVEIVDSMTGGDLHDILMNISPNVLMDTLDYITKKDYKTKKQDNEEATYAPLIKKEMAKIDWNKDVLTIHNLIRGYNPWPCAYTFYKDKIMKVHKASIIDKESIGEAGTIVNVDKEGIIVNTLRGRILLEVIQMPNSKKMHVSEFIKGNKIDLSIKLGEL